MPDNRNARADALLNVTGGHGEEPLKVFLARHRAWARPTTCCQRPRSCAARASMSWSASSRRTDVPRPMPCLRAWGLPHCRLRHQGRTLEEFDLDAALARRRPCFWLTSWHTATHLAAAISTAGRMSPSCWRRASRYIPHSMSSTWKASMTRSGASPAWRSRNRAGSVSGSRRRHCAGGFAAARADCATEARQGLPAPGSQPGAHGFLFTDQPGALRTGGSRPSPPTWTMTCAKPCWPAAAACRYCCWVTAAIDGHGQSEYLVRVTRRIADRHGTRWSIVFVDTGALLMPADRRASMPPCG